MPILPRQLPALLIDDQSRPILSCKFIVSEGMNISELAPKLVGCLRTKLGQSAVSIPRAEEDAPASNGSSGAPGSNDGSDGANGQ